MKRLLLFAFMVIIGTATASAAKQGEATLRGKVLDKTGGEPAGWATVALMGADSTVVAGTACDENGVYELKAAAGEYILTASLIGYLDQVLNITLAPGTTEAEPIYLEPDAQQIAGATLTERVKLIDVKIDKVVMNVSQSAFAHGSNAMELLKKAPGVTIDKDGNVKLNGRAVSIWIDGRPSHVDGKALEALLMSTGSDSVEKFELMEHPSAKYDASGQGGIINIKTKRNMLQGFNGSVGLGGGGMYFSSIDETPWEQTAWADLSYRGKRTNTFLNVYEGIYNNPMRFVNDLRMDLMDFTQSSDGIMKSSYKAYNVKIGNDWFIDKRNTLGVILYVPGSNYSFNSKSSTSCQYVGGVQTQEARTSINNGPNTSVQHNLNLNYTHVFDEARSSEITANLDYFNNVSANDSRQTDTTYMASMPLTPVLTRKTMDSDNVYDVYSAKADYQSVVAKKFMLESGAKWALSRTDNTSLETQTFVPDNPSDFIYREHVAAAYASLAGQLGPKLSFKAGLRGEYTNTFGDWKSLGTDTRRDYFDIFPTAFVGFMASEKCQLSASYSRRINRPRYSQLNPAKTYIDSKTYTVGNPDILPQYSSDISLSAMFGQHMSLSLGFDRATKVVNQIPSYDTDGTQYLTWGNTGTMNMGFFGANVSALPVTKWLQWTVNTALLYMNSIVDQTGSVTNCWSGQGYTDFTFVLPKDWKIDLDGFVSAPMVFGYYRIHTNWQSNIAAKKTLLDNRMTLTFKLDDIFRSSRQNLDVCDASMPDVFTSLQQIYFNQKFVFDLTWNFGKAQGPTRQRKVGNLEEISRAGGGNSSGVGK